jgi:dTDP-4-amino-4,6-dideoxygalactose transaminase
MKKIPYGRQYIDKKDTVNVVKSLKSELITTGLSVKKFEKDLNFFLKSKFALTCNSGTSAIHMAFKGIDLKKDDIIIMPVVNFIASYNMAKMLNAKIYLADIDRLSGQMTPEKVIECIKKNKLKKIKAILTMYMGGYPENIVGFSKLKKKLNCYMIEDACHALGAKYRIKAKNFMIGSCKHVDISTFSLHPLKTITSGEGGVATTNKKYIYDNMARFRSHGIIRDKKKHWNYDVIETGQNYRLSDINCALGISQLKKANNFINYRKKIYNTYKNKLKKYHNLIKLFEYQKSNSPSFHLFLISIDFKKIRKSKNSFMKYMLDNNIVCQFHYIPIYKFRTYVSKKLIYKDTEYYFRNTVSLPIYYGLKMNQQNYIIKKIEEFLN